MKVPSCFRLGSSERQKAFTLVEIMIVVAILAIIASLAIPAFLRARDRAMATAILNEARMVRDAINQWSLEKAIPRGAVVVPGEVAPFIKDGKLVNLGLTSSPTIPTVTFTLNNVGVYPQVQINYGATFQTDIVPTSFWDGYQ